MKLKYNNILQKINGIYSVVTFNSNISLNAVLNSKNNMLFIDSKSISNISTIQKYNSITVSSANSFYNSINNFPTIHIYTTSECLENFTYSISNKFKLNTIKLKNFCISNPIIIRNKKIEFLSSYTSYSKFYGINENHFNDNYEILSYIQGNNKKIYIQPNKNNVYINLSLRSFYADLYIRQHNELNNIDYTISALNLNVYNTNLYLNNYENASHSYQKIKLEVLSTNLVNTTCYRQLALNTDYSLIGNKKTNINNSVIYYLNNFKIDLQHANAYYFPCSSNYHNTFVVSSSNACQSDLFKPNFREYQESSIYLKEYYLREYENDSLYNFYPQNGNQFITSSYTLNYYTNNNILINNNLQYTLKNHVHNFNLNSKNISYFPIQTVDNKLIHETTTNATYYNVLSTGSSYENKTTYLPIDYTIDNAFIPQNSVLPVGSIIGWMQTKQGNSWKPEVPIGFYQLTNTTSSVLVEIDNIKSTKYNGQLAALCNAQTYIQLPSTNIIKINNTRIIKILKYSDNWDYKR